MPERIPDANQILYAVYDQLNQLLNVSGGGGGGGGSVAVTSLPPLPAGTNNIGDVDVLTLPALVAGNALIGRVTSPLIGSAVDVAPITATTTSGSLITDDAARNHLIFRNTGTVDCWLQHSGTSAQVNRGYILQAGSERTFYGGLAAKAWAVIAVSSTADIAIGGGVI